MHSPIPQGDESPLGPNLSTGCPSLELLPDSLQPFLQSLQIAGFDCMLDGGQSIAPIEFSNLHAGDEAMNQPESRV